MEAISAARPRTRERHPGRRCQAYLPDLTKPRPPDLPLAVGRGAQGRQRWPGVAGHSADTQRSHSNVRDAIKGHAPRTEGERYGGNVPLSAKWVEINRLKRYEVEPPTEPPLLLRKPRRAVAKPQSGPPRKPGRPPGKRPLPAWAT
jgi:hypothetical protein